MGAGADVELDDSALAGLEAGDASPLGDDPRLAAAVTAVEDPERTLRLTIDGVVYPGWVSGGSAALTEPGTGGKVRVVALAAGGVATRLARIVELGPRPLREQPELVEILSERLERALAERRELTADEARGALDLPREAPDDIAAAIGRIPASLRSRWALDVTAADGEQLALLGVLDAGDDGYWQVIPAAAPGSVLLASASTAILWAQLAAAAPG